MVKPGLMGLRVANEVPPGRSKLAASRYFDEYGVLMFAVLIAIALFLASPGVTDVGAMTLITQEASVLGLAALGLSLLHHAGEFDLSCGAIFALSVVVLATLAPHVAMPTAVTATILVAGACGLVNGIAAATLGNALLITFAASYWWRQAAQALSDGSPVTLASAHMQNLAPLVWTPLLGVSASFLILIVASILVCLFFSQTLSGRNLLAVGSDSDRASLVGLNAARYKIASFCFAGIMTGLSATVYLSRLSSASAQAGAFLPFEALTAIAIANSGLRRDAPNPFRLLVAVICIVVISISISLLSKVAVGSDLAIGFLLLVALVYGRIRQRVVI